MLNVKSLTDTMSRMPLPQLQQYAALHKNDPYVVTLALSIANQKKQMQAGKAGQVGMMPQPKVVDQQISDMAAVDPMGNVTGAQMLPEDTGIGQLPAQNMRRMAEGGIVAFDDGGSVPGYAEGVFTEQDPKQDFAQKYRNAAIYAGRQLGVDPGIIISQWGLETAWGKKIIPGTNNLGNIKDFSGKGVSAYDKQEKSTSKYRAYDSTEDFAKAYVDLIKNKYPDSVGAGGDAKKFVTGLRPGKPGGYATDKNYASKFLAVTPIPIAEAATSASTQTPAPTTAPAGAPTRLSDKSIPTDYKKEQSLQQAAQDAEIKKLQSEGFLDKTSRVGKGIVGNLEAGTNVLTGMAGYPLGYLGAIATDPTGAAAAIQNQPAGAGFYDRMKAIQSDFTYQPRTAVGEAQAEDLSKSLSFLPPYLAGPGSLRRSKLNAPKLVEPTTKPGLPGIAESQTAKAAKAAEQLPLFPELETAPATAPAAAYPSGIFGPEPAVSAAVQAARAKQVAAKAALQKDGPEIGNRFFEPEPTTFPITPENAGIAAVQRNIIAKNKAAEAAARAEAAKTQEPAKPAEVPSKPAESVATPETVAVPEEVAPAPKETIPAMTEAEMLDRARTFELEQQKADIIRRNQDRAKFGLPGIATPVPVTGVEDREPAYVANTAAAKYPPGVMGGERLPSAEEGIIAALKEKPEETKTAEAPAAGGMNWGDLALKMGLNLLAGKSPNALQNVGEAGLATLGMQQAETKAKSEAEARLAEALKNKSLGRYYESYAAATERGAKEKNLELEAEKLIAQEMAKDKFLNMPGQEAARAARERQMRETIYRNLGITPTMAAGAPAGQRLSYNPETGKIG